MKHFCQLLGNRGEIIADYSNIANGKNLPISISDLMGFLKKQPRTINDISQNFNFNRMEVIKLLDGVLSKENLNSEKRNGNCITGYNLHRVIVW